MPAEFEQGFSVREPAWHGLATVLDEYPGREEAMRLAGHDFRVIEVPVYAEIEGDTSFSFSPVQPVKGWKALRKDSDGTVLNVVRDTYTVVQNDVLWDIVDAIVEQPAVKYETAGVLKGGAVLWVLARLDEPLQVPGDNTLVYPYIAVSTTHDGSGGVMGRATWVRIICWNTFTQAEAQSKRDGREFHFRHTARVHERIELAREMLLGVREDFRSTFALMSELADVEVSDAQLERFLVDFIPAPPETIISDRVARNVEEARDAVRSILNGPTLATTRNTAYGLVQAGVEYLDHVRGYRSNETHLGRTLLRAEPLKAKLVPLVREVIAAGA